MRRLRIGLRIGRIVLIAKSGDSAYIVKCDCGREKRFYSSHLSGIAQRCGIGCPLSDARKTHGFSRTPTWVSYRAMLDRCYSPTYGSYKNYGARGVTVCARWRRSFQAFLEDMGVRPSGMTLDRYPNPRGQHSPSNCRWATNVEQQRNKGNSRLVLLHGKTMCLSEAVAILGVRNSTLDNRIERIHPEEYRQNKPMEVSHLAYPPATRYLRKDRRTA